MVSSFGAKSKGLHNDGINIAARRGTNHAQLAVRQHPAAAAMHYRRSRRLQGSGQRAGALAIALEQREGHALRGLRPDARQRAQGIEEGLEAAGGGQGDRAGRRVAGRVRTAA